MITNNRMGTMYNVANPMVYPLLREKAKNMKKNPTEAERVMWELVRRRQLGVVFKRQYIIDEYIVDFVCLEKRLIVEVDGAYHSAGEQKELDKKREDRLIALGYHILRFSNSEVMVVPDKVVEKIKQDLPNPSKGGAINNE